MPSWERLQEGPEEPITDDLDADILLTENRSHRSTNLLQTVRNFFILKIRYFITILIALLVLIPLIIFFIHIQKQVPPKTSQLVPSHFPIVIQSTTPFLDPVEFENSNFSVKSFNPPEFSPMLDFLYEYLSLLGTSDLEMSNTTNNSGPLEFTIFYESLSISSRIFLTHQFFPTFFKAYIETQGQNMSMIGNLIPYGHTNITINPETSVEKLTCENGYDECQGNLVHACAISHTRLNDIESRLKLMHYIDCMMSDTGKGGAILNTEAGNIGISCAKTGGIDWNPIYNCTQTRDGFIILHTFRNITNSLLEKQRGKDLAIPIVYLKGYGILSEEEKKDFEKFSKQRLQPKLL